MSAATRQFVSLRAAVALAVALGVLAAPLVAAPVPQKGGDKTTYAIAFGPDNQPLAGLTKDEFAIREDGVDRAVVSAKQATDPLDIYLIIDTSKSSSPSISDLRTALLAFAKTLFDGPAPVTMTVVDSAGASMAVAENKKTFADVQKPLEKTFADQTNNTVILEAVNEAAQKLAKSTTSRRAIAVVNMDSIPEGSSLKSQDVMLKVMGAGASLWTVTYQNNATKNLSVNPSAAGAATSNAAKASSGGVGTGDIGQSRDYVLIKAPALGGLHAALTTSTALTETLTQMAQAIVNQYAVTYTRPDGPAPKLFQMATTREGAKVGFSQIPVK